jgi:hypothetical protein
LTRLDQRTLIGRSVNKVLLARQTSAASPVTAPRAGVEAASSAVVGRRSDLEFMRAFVVAGLVVVVFALADADG